ncbi:MAG: hypothetical protein R3A10_21685 [Caldilineaceae bacterium]
MALAYIFVAATFAIIGGIISIFGGVPSAQPGPQLTVAPHRAADVRRSR